MAFHDYVSLTYFKLVIKSDNNGIITVSSHFKNNNYN